MNMTLVSALFHLSLYLLLSLAFATNNSTNLISQGTTITKSNCSSKCGDVTIPYPFGIGPGCSISRFDTPWFDVNCNTTYNPPKPFINTLTNDTEFLEILEIKDDQLLIKNKVCAACQDKPNTRITMNLEFTTFTFSDKNSFFVVGCNVTGSLQGTESRDYDTYCVPTCSNPEDLNLTEVDCSGGYGCCQDIIPRGIPKAKLFINQSVATETGCPPSNGCGYAFVGDTDNYKFTSSHLTDKNFKDQIEQNVFVIIDWVIGKQTCSQIKKRRDFACQKHSDCVDSETGFGGYRCRCKGGYKGNPYLPPGCTDFDECSDLNTNHCINTCTNTQGGFKCSCPLGKVGDGRSNGKGCQFPVMEVALGIGFGFLALVLAVAWIYSGHKKRKIIKVREKFFKQNGGLLLKPQSSVSEGPVESTKIFTAEELERATNNYADDRILGRGGCGTVYKGILSDKLVVAVKMSRVMDESQIEQFINEVSILTQVNHRHVVRLLGCCLEFEVPLLVYEYVSNGTLYEHIHSLAWLSWEDRLRIASESASALSYLHSATSIPVIHRDVKSTNILIDESYNAKISDFGASRLISLDQTEVTTMVQGTLGYLDPEYFYTSQLTEKSDVYSFGVVLVELMTGKRPIDMERIEEQRNLSRHFLASLKENRLFQILEPRVLREGSLEQLQAIAELAKRCLQLTGKDRPTMKEVVMELEWYRKFTVNPRATQYVRQESIVLMDETETADLYTVPIDPYMNRTEEFSGPEFKQ